MRGSKGNDVAPLEVQIPYNEAVPRRDKELDHEYRMRRIQLFSQAWQSFMRFACWAVMGLTFYYSVRELAGQHTFADIQFKALADLKANKYFGVIFPWGLFGITAAWGTGERWLRKRHIKRVSSEHSELQKAVDERRRSSHLSKKGETRPEDI